MGEDPREIPLRIYYMREAGSRGEGNHFLTSDKLLAVRLPENRSLIHKVEKS